MLYDWAKKASAEFGKKVVFQSVDTFDKETIREWGIWEGIYIDGENIQQGPPPEYEEISGKIKERVELLNRE